MDKKEKPSMSSEWLKCSGDQNNQGNDERNGGVEVGEQQGEEGDGDGDDDDDEDEASWLAVNDEDDANLEEEETMCLFCKQTFGHIEMAMNHIHQEHGIDFIQLKRKFKMSQYDFIKLINCIRRHSLTPETLLAASSSFWKDDTYLTPKHYETWLCYDYESLDGEGIESNEEELEKEMFVTQKPFESIEQLTNPKDRIICRLQEHLANMKCDMNTMRQTYARLVTSIEHPTSTESKPLVNSGDPYFQNYGHHQIHHEMLSDEARTISYRDAFMKNMEFVRGKDVLDVGCGTGILSIFAQRAGARKVVAIDNSNIIQMARNIIQNNSIENIELIHGCVENSAALPAKHFDIIVSEWMGYFLLFEGMLNSVIYARDKFLKPGGILMPNRCSLHLCGLGGDSYHKRYISFWDDVYGVNMSVMKATVIQEPQLEDIDPKDIITEEDCLVSLDLMTIDSGCSNFEHKIQLICIRDGLISGLIGYFRVYFDLPQHKVELSTAPSSPSTHWKQCVFLLPEPHPIRAGEKLEGLFRCQTSLHSSRSLDIIITMFGKEQKFHLD